MFWIAWKGYNNGTAVSLGAAAQAQAQLYGMHGYPTQAEAEAHPNSVSGFEKLFVNAQLKASNPAQAASNAVAGATGISWSSWQQAVGTVSAKLTDGKMWRSLGWLALGISLIIFGLLLWIGPGAVKASPYGRAFSAVRGSGLPGE